MSPKPNGFFHFNRREKIGILVLGFVLFSSLLFRYYQRHTVFEPTATSAELELIWNKLDSIEESNTRKSTQSAKKRKQPQPIKLTPFNPNALDLGGWMNLGFSEKQAQSILNYKKKAGDFQVKADFKKLFVVSEKRYAELEAYVALPDSFARNERLEVEHEPRRKRQVIVLVNTADSTAFTSISGIGPVLSKRIVKYRESLGGFYTLNQLSEVYGISDSFALQLHEHIRLDTVQLVKLNVNEASVEQLRKHPYLDWQLARAIVAYRKQHGHYRALDDLLQIHLIEQPLFKKIEIYLTL